MKVGESGVPHLASLYRCTAATPVLCRQVVIHLGIPRPLHGRFGHVPVDPRHVRPQTRCNARGHGKCRLESGDHVGHGEKYIADLEILPLGQRGLDDRAQEVAHSSEVVQLCDCQLRPRPNRWADSRWVR
jgi:hypothetical protein